METLETDRQTKIPYYFVAFVISLVSIYIFPSGGAQLVDVPVLFTSFYILFTARAHEIKPLNLVVILGAFAYWALCVNMVGYLTSHNPFYVKASVHVFYTIILFLIFSILFIRVIDKMDLIPYLYTGILISTILPFLIAGQPETGATVRQSLSFNNPNQLALFSLLIMATVLVLNNHYDVRFSGKYKGYIIFVSVLTFILGHYFIILSASRAGLFSLILIDIIAVSTLKKSLPLIILLGFVLTLGIYKGLVLEDVNISEMKIVARTTNMDYYSKLENRTEGRFSLDDLSLVFGVGKSGRRVGSKEIHNTFVDLIYSYGLIGGCLFSIFIFYYLKDCLHTKYHLFILLAFTPMNISHNLFRFRLVWILLALIYSINIMHGRIRKKASGDSLVHRSPGITYQINRPFRHTQYSRRHSA